MHGLPHITLDTTLAELYSRGCPEAQGGKIAKALFVASSEVAPTTKFARNRKFLYQDPTFSSTPNDSSLEQQREVRRSILIGYLSLVPQRDAFATGNMPVVLFGSDESGSSARSQKEAEMTMSVLTEGQRPNLMFFPGPKEVRMEDCGIDTLAVKMPLDDLEGLPHVVGVETHYFLNSKAALCTSGLPSPKSTLIEIHWYSPSSSVCCRVCASRQQASSIPSTCTGPRITWLRTQIAQTLSRLSAHPTPFVLKTQQGFGGGGTYFVSTPSDLRSLSTLLENRILPKLYTQVHAGNAHLHPASLVVSEMVREPVGNWGLTFFVTRAGEAVFLAATRQVVNESQLWVESYISYPAQDGLRAKFKGIMRQIGVWLSGYEYYGPCGADILETTAAHQGNSYQPVLQIVDLNVRLCGSHVLGLMRGHFSRRRGLHEGSIFSVTVRMRREGFLARFADEFGKGEMVIVSWYEDEEAGVSSGNVVVGAADEGGLRRKIRMIRDVCAAAERNPEFKVML
ncbi:MAG: hypothetical protein LQ341_003382 [Variospora aurantia]|nr:MAG: hypothetical protein LQ341_003382 [Variospora aurantia]